MDSAPTSQMIRAVIKTYETSSCESVARIPSCGVGCSWTDNRELLHAKQACDLGPL